MRTIRGMAIVVLGMVLVMSGGHAARAQAPGAGQGPRAGNSLINEYCI